MLGLENLPFPLKILLALIADLIDALNIIPGVGDLVETPLNALRID